MKNSFKKVIALMLALLVVLPISAVAVFADGTGDGDGAGTGTTTPKYEVNKEWKANADGVFEIKTPGDLLAFLDDNVRKTNGSYTGKTIVLANDIDLNPGWDATSGTDPVNLAGNIFYMKGTFDGQGHTISGLCIIKDGADNASMVTMSEGGTTFKNVNIVNSLFSARIKVNGTTVSGGNGAGILSCAAWAATFENVYLDAICEAQNGYAGGFVSWFNATDAKKTPSVTIRSSVFAGTVTAAKAAGGFVGTNDRPADKSVGAAKDQGAGLYQVTMVDCVNYGTISSDIDNMAGGLVGNLANKGAFTRCYGFGAADAALFNIHKSTTVNADNTAVVAITQDCYYMATSTDVVATTAAADSLTTVTLNYGSGDTASVETAVKAATPAELVELDAFKKNDNAKGWALYETVALPVSVKCQVTTHSYTDRVVPPVGCGSDGYTEHTCTACGHVMKDTYVKADPHNYESKVEPATCTKKGYTEHKCTACGDTYKDTETPIIPHTESDWIVDKEPTTEYSGKKHTECTVCKEQIKFEILPKLTADNNTEDGADDGAADNNATTETAAPETTAPETTAAADDTTAADDKGGCGSSIALGGMVLMTTVLSLGATTVSKKRK